MTERNDEMTVKDLIIISKEWAAYVASKSKTLVLFCLLGAAIGLALSFIIKPVYTASTTFVLEDGEKGGGMLSQYAGIASAVGVDLGGGGSGLFSGDNIIQLYRSQTMIREALLTPVSYDGGTHLLIDRYVRYKKLQKKWDKKPQLKGINFNNPNGKPFNRAQDSLLTDIVKDINKNYLSVARPDKKLTILEVDVSFKDEYFAKTFNNLIVQKVNDFYITTKTKKATTNVQILQDKTDSVRKTMNMAISTAATVLDATPNLNLSRQFQRNVPVQKSQFSIETNKAVLGELLKNLELSKITLLKETPLIQIIDQPIYPLEVDKLGKVKGTIIGAVFALFLGLMVITLNRIFRNIINE